MRNRRWPMDSPHKDQWYRKRFPVINIVINDLRSDFINTCSYNIVYISRISPTPGISGALRHSLSALWSMRINTDHYRLSVSSWSLFLLLSIHVACYIRNVNYYVLLCVLFVFCRDWIDLCVWVMNRLSGEIYVSSVLSLRRASLLAFLHWDSFPRTGAERHHFDRHFHSLFVQPNPRHSTPVAPFTNMV